MKKTCIILAIVAVFTATGLTSCGRRNNGTTDGTTTVRTTTVSADTGMVSDILDGSMENRNLR